MTVSLYKGPHDPGGLGQRVRHGSAEINTYDEYEQYIEQAYNTYGATVQLPMSGEPGFGYLTAGFGTLASFGNSFEATLPWYQIDGSSTAVFCQRAFRSM